MNNFRGMPPGALAEETLKEIPDQFLGFMQRHGIEPMPPTQAPDIQSVEQMLLSQLGVLYSLPSMAMSQILYPPTAVSLSECLTVSLSVCESL